MHIPTLIGRLALPVGVVLVVAACAGGQSAGWTFAPLGPSANPSAPASAAASGGASSPGASGAPSSPSGSGATAAVELKTTQGNPLAFEPNTFTVPASAQVTVNYNNDSTLPHNVHFFAGPDSSAPSLGATQVVTGPANVQTVTFGAPGQPGSYFFWCDVHGAAMSGTYNVQ